MTRTKFGLSLVLGLFLTFQASAQSKEEGRATVGNIQAMMYKKLSAAQQILAALVTKDFASLKREAQQLSDISMVTTWHRAEDAEFVREAQSFRNAVEFLNSQASANDLGGVSLGFVRTVMSCMMCHNYVRDNGKKP